MQTLSTTWRIIPVRSSSSVLVTRHLQAMVINHLLAGRDPPSGYGLFQA